MLLPWPPTAGDTNLDIRALPVSQSGMFAVLLHNSAATGVSETGYTSKQESMPVRRVPTALVATTICQYRGGVGIWYTYHRAHLTHPLHKPRP